ncbi:HpcH/HpaI aldolase family protein [Pseudooceanicola nitratireducens]|uniref:HpcH/HpaI aldolase family protein n=1 Tax=Pseudooceanicola nitratireducens TaxID=517719 RepID=UPI001C95401E|nr:aldolase/citrate lyase family protein [Pseudooceanicola nitratireducens]MBY6156154.1 HpcH/HpaI aldolase/citrate lyase family protein [Pseudooceanicola nitratireducens]
MDLPKNRFKAALKAGQHQTGFWNTIAGPIVPEALAAQGFDWIVVDTEHTTTEAFQVHASLQAIAAYPDVSAVVRPVSNDPAYIKRYLDMGAQTLMIPYVQTADEARAAVTAMRYPPRGIRGMAGGTRASRYGLVKDYMTRAEEELCLIVQVETASALEQLEEIALVEGVDAVFIGPADLSGSMGHPGNQAHADVVAAIEDAFARLKAINVPSGILTLNEDFARRLISLGSGFTAIGTDISSLMRDVSALKARLD